MSTKTDKLLSKLKTEQDHWKVIEGLGGMIFSTNHAVSHGRIEDTATVGREVSELRELQLAVVGEVREKFGVIMPNDPDYPADTPRSELHTVPPPEGKQWYWIWYDEMKEQIFGWEYDHLICNACPYSQGRDRYIGNNGRYPCNLLNGWSKVMMPSQCTMIEPEYLNSPFNIFIRSEALNGRYLRRLPSHIGMDRDQFLQKLKGEHGPKALLAFLKSERSLNQQMVDGTLKPEFGY